MVRTNERSLKLWGFIRRLVLLVKICFSWKCQYVPYSGILATGNLPIDLCVFCSIELYCVSLHGQFDRMLEIPLQYITNKRVLEDRSEYLNWNCWFLLCKERCCSNRMNWPWPGCLLSLRFPFQAQRNKTRSDHLKNQCNTLLYWAKGQPTKTN